MLSSTDDTQKWVPLPQEYCTLAASSANSLLLETGKWNSGDDRSFLFLNPESELVAHRPDELDALLAEVELQLAAGRYVAGYFSYECGEKFVGLPSEGRNQSDPIAWLGVYSQPLTFHHRSGTKQGFLPVSFGEIQGRLLQIECSDVQMSFDEYREKIDRIQSYLQSGDTYQVNFTDRVCGSLTGSPLQLYAELLRRQPVSYAAFLNRPGYELISLSPELFYRIHGPHISVRPMKGTWPRGRSVGEDDKAKEELFQDEKNRSEHIMIVDLLRNDLGRVCERGTVKVDELFHIERYNTLFQMTSAISGKVEPSQTATQIFRAMFPSGSVTGAPKRRTMEIIRELERVPRGPYTGAIGFFAPNGDACFNVAIRTLLLRGNTFTLGVGGGITVGSRAEAEYDECRLKGTFLTKERLPFSLIETMKVAHGRIAHLDEHLDRLASSANYFGIDFDLQLLRAELCEIAAACECENRLRLELSESGQTKMITSPLANMHWKGALLVSAERTLSSDVFLRHKTTNRTVYEDELKFARQQGFDEVLFTNERDELTEGAISNVFLRFGDGWLTPALNCGVLPGVQRAALLKSLSNVREAVLSVNQLSRADEVIVCNALRGVRAVSSVLTLKGRTVTFANPTLGL